MEFATTAAAGQLHQDKQGLEAVIEEARLAEDLGFSTVFVPDHYLFEQLGAVQWDQPIYELFFVLATLAQRTSRVRLGSHVACTLFRHPAMLARLFAQLDEASGGRVIAGVGAGWTKVEFDMLGIDFPPISERLRMMDEAVAIMRGLWSDERFSYEGEHYRVTDAVSLPRPVQKPGPPIMLGGSGAGILRRAGSWADIVHMIPETGRAGTTTMENVAKFNDEVISGKLKRVREAEKEAGREEGAVKFATTIFTYQETASAADTAELAEGLAPVFGLSPEQYRRHPVVLVGTPEEMEEELTRRREAYGISLLTVAFSTPEQMRQFGEQVLPRFS